MDTPARYKVAPTVTALHRRERLRLDGAPEASYRNSTCSSPPEAESPPGKVTSLRSRSTAPDSSNPRG